MTLVIALSNRRDLYLPDALASLQQHVTGWDDLVIVDDSGDEDWRDQLETKHKVVRVDDTPAGYTAAMRTVWAVARMYAGPFFFLEEDFRFVRPVDLAQLQSILDGNQQLAQLALRRAPWYRNERRIGVLRAQRIRVDHERRLHGRNHSRWTQHLDFVEHDAGITGNPGLWSAAALKHDWPDVEWSETAMGNQLHTAGLTSGWLGTITQADHDVEHCGHTRADHSTGY